MSELFRLAVIKGGDGPCVVVECGGFMLPLVRLIDMGGIAPPRDLKPVIENWDEMDGAIAGAVEAGRARFAAEGMSADSVDFLPPFAAPGKLLCIGANYHDHIAEMPIPMTPSYPYSFFKPVNNTIRGSGDAVAVPPQSSMMDWEAELGVVIGTVCANVSTDDAYSVIAGYLNFNDLSARDWLDKRPPIGVDWVQHKAFDGFAPIGPYFVPARFIPDPQDLPVHLSVNDVVKQDSNTSQMVFGVAEIIAHASSIMTLYPGDIIGTGTPAGTGHGRGEYLRAGDVVRMEIGPLGELVTPIC